MAIDSKVAFQNRAVELGIEQAEIDALDDAGVHGYATYAYCSTHQPGQSDNTVSNAFLTTTLGNAPSAAATTRFRSLFFEALALSLGDLKSRAGRSESSEARIIPLAEKMDGIRQQKGRLNGLSYTPQSEASHALIDKVCQQFEDNMITYIELNRCTFRQVEALHSKGDTALALDNSGSLRLSKKQRLDDVNVTGERKRRQAFLPRALAYDLSGISTSAVLDLWTHKILEKMNEAPLSNYRHISVEQAVSTDKALWVKVSNDTRGKLQPKTGTDKPFDVAFTKSSEHPEVPQHLTPLQSVGQHRLETSHFTFTSEKDKGGHQNDSKGKSSMGKGKLDMASQYLTTVRFLLMASSFASVG